MSLEQFTLPAGLTISGVQNCFGDFSSRFFCWVDKARSRELGGTCLGLSILKHLSQIFGGSIRVKSVQGEGATFTVELLMA
ncbi:cell wall metabolism sensor histidine kinase WalK [Planctomycetaceae bacterium]|nr:cell wall metabolism sensor histidine kinase WalK [bacterium]MDC0273261.1 cell wall metabolism sensor histidine kinase WalK [Planctomycetaceae bacterium]